MRRKRRRKESVIRMAFELTALNENYEEIITTKVLANDLGEAYEKVEKKWAELGIEPYDIAEA